jgi:hypothetical protein
MSAGKGDDPRPVNKKKFNKNFDEISWKKVIEKKELKNKNGKVSYLYK